MGEGINNAKNWPLQIDSWVSHGGRIPYGPIECNVFEVQVTVKHILIECHKYDIQRQTVFGNDTITLKYMLLEADASLNGEIYNFIKSIDILPEI